jgi:cytosine/adenosine deaminase-related metal-dependent hydrolase
MRQRVDLLILNGTVVTFDEHHQILDSGGLAIDGDRIVAVGGSRALKEAYEAECVVDAADMVIMPGLVDTYGHAGHGMVGGFYHPDAGWPAGRLYWHGTTEDWWFAESQLAAAERLRFGVTTGASIVGSTPARTDSPRFAVRCAEAYEKVGIRAVLGVGPPDPFIPHLPRPWTGSFLEDGEWVERAFTYDETVRNSLDVVETWHGGGNGRIRIALAPPYLFGRHAFHGHFEYTYRPGDVGVMIEKAEEMRDLADQYRVQIHTHVMKGGMSFALHHFGRERVERLLGPDVVIAHGNGIGREGVEVIGSTRSNVASAPSTMENVRYGYAPVVEFLEAGANVTIATDGSAPRFSFDLWKDIVRAMWHQWMIHRTQHVLPPGKALRMVTLDAAKALGMGDEIGSLEQGKKADVILVDFNRLHLTPRTFLPQQLTYYVTGHDVHTVIVGGRILMEDRKIRTVDVEEVKALAREEAARAFERVDLEPYCETGPQFWLGARY